MSVLIERIRFAVVLAGAFLLALPACALAGPGDGLTQAAAGASDTAQQAAPATTSKAASDPQQATEAAPKPRAAAPETPDTSAPAAAGPAASEPAPTKEALQTVSQKAESAARATGAAAKSVSDTAGSTTDAVRTGDSLTAASEGAGPAEAVTNPLDELRRDAASTTTSTVADVERKLDSTAGQLGQNSRAAHGAAQQAIPAVGANDLPPTDGLTGGDLPSPPPGTENLPSASDGGSVLSTLLGSGKNLLRAGGGSILGGDGPSLPGSGGGNPGYGSLPAGGGGAGRGSFPGGGSGAPTVTSAPIAQSLLSRLLTGSFPSLPGASFAAMPVSGAGSGSPAPDPGHRPAPPFALPSFGAGFGDGLLLTAGLLALLAIFFLTVPGLDRWIRTSAEKWPPPGLVSPIEVPG